MSFFLAFALSILSSISLCSKRGVVTKQLTQGKSLGAGRVQVLTVKKKKNVLYVPFHSPNPPDQSQPLMGPFKHKENYCS